MNEINDEVPSLAKVIKDAIESRLAELHVSLPAEIVDYDGKKATVQPLLQRKYTDDTVVTLPVVTNVPVIWPSTALSSVTLPLAKGDSGTLLICERSIDQWLVAGGTVEPNDPRKFSLSDAQFFPGLKSLDKDTDYDPERAVLRHGDGIVTIKANGKVQVKNTSTGAELMAIIDAVLTGMAGESFLFNKPIYAAEQVKLLTLKE